MNCSHAVHQDLGACRRTAHRRGLGGFLITVTGELRGFARWNGQRWVIALLARLQRHPPVALAVGVAWKLRVATEVEIRLLRLANGPAAVTALKIKERLRLLGSSGFLVFRRHHDRAARAGPAVVARAANGKSF